MTATQGNRYRSLDAPQQLYEWRGHRIAYYSQGTGAPLLLVHSINAAASAFEMRGPFFGLRDSHTVYALDLLGYGGSDRPARRYSDEDYVALISDFTRDVVGRGAPVVASSLSSAYVVKAAARDQSLFGPLVLVCPTGLQRLVTPMKPGLGYRALRGPAGDALFAALSSRPSIRLFLRQQAYYDEQKIAGETLEGFYQTAKQPGAKWAPICFVTMQLNCDIRAEWPQLQQPILIVWGREASTTPPSDAEAFLKSNQQARLALVDHTKLLVQDERPAEFNQLVREFLPVQALSANSLA
jgi:pimeloyl-ACP methyl ester carboxylesterase